MIFFLLTVWCPVCLGRRYFTVSNSSAHSQPSWFFTIQDTVDTRSVAKIILGVLIIILIIMFSFLMIRIGKRFCGRRKIPASTPASPVFSISSSTQEKIFINNISIVINSCHCNNHLKRVKDIPKEEKYERGRSSEQILDVVNEILQYEFG